MSEEELKAEIARINEQLERLSGGITPASRAITDLGKAAGMSAGQVEDVVAGARIAGQGLISFSKNLTDGDKSMVKYGRSLNTLFSGLGDMIMAFGPLGFALGGLVKVVGAITEGVMNYNQAYLDAYDTLAQFGFAGEEVADNIKDMAQATGYNREKILDLAKITTRLSTDVTSFGSTAGQGQRFFIEIAKVGATTRENFLRLGISQEELTGIQADYLKQQAKLTNFTIKDQASLREGSKRYAETLVDLSALTGKSRQEVQSSFEEQQKDYKYQAYLQQAMAEKGQDYVDNLNKNLVDVAESISPEYSRAFREVISTGVARGEDARMVQTALGDDLYKYAEIIKKGGPEAEKVVQLVRDRVEQNKKNLLRNGVITDELVKLAGANNDAMTNSIKKREEGTAKLVEEQRKFAELPKPDDLKRTQADKVEMEIAYGSAMDNIIQLLSGPVNYALQGMYKAVTYFSKAIYKVTPGAKNLDHMFKDSQEISSEFNTKSKELIQLQKDKAAGKTTSRDPSKIGRDLVQDIEQNKPFIRPDKVKSIDQQIKELKQELDQLREAYIFQTGKPIPESNPVTPNTPSGKDQKGGGRMEPAGWFEEGIMSGPDSGYLSAMTGMSAVVPLPDGKTIPVSFTNLPQELTNKKENPLADSNNINSMMQSYAKAIPNITASLMNQINLNQQAPSSLSDDMVLLVANKMDTLIDNLKRNNDYQNDLLQYIKK